MTDLGILKKDGTIDIKLRAAVLRLVHTDKLAEENPERMQALSVALGLMKN